MIDQSKKRNPFLIKSKSNYAFSSEIKKFFFCFYPSFDMQSYNIINIVIRKDLSYKYIEENNNNMSSNQIILSYQ
jgi:hypothetical protein